MDTKILERIGLTPGEIKAYMALLELGSSSTGPLANKSQVSRSKLYSIMDKLEKKGLASHVEKNGVVYFQAVEPAKVKDYLKEKKEELETLETEFEKFLPRLESFHKHAGEVQNVTVYQGLKGLQTCYEHYYLKVKKGGEQLCIGVPAYQPEAHHRYWHKDHLKRASLGIKCRMLFNRDTPKEILANRNSYSLCDARYMPTDLKTPSYFIIYADTVMIAIPSENPIAIEIVSREIADAFRAYFEEFWKRSEKFK